MKTWLITGCSTGFGRVFAEAVLARGDKLVATARNVATIADFVRHYPESAAAMPLNVTRKGEAEAAVAKAETMFGGLDVLVNNAGFGLIGAIEETEPEEYRPMFETNLFGVIETTRAALPALRQRRGGRIINFSSIGGITGRQDFGLYNATKFAVEGFSEALAEEVAPFGIAVIIVEPGAFRTDFLGRSIATAARRIAAYDETSGRTRDFGRTNDGQQPGDPHRAIDVLLAAADSATPPLRLPLGKDAFTRISVKIDKLQADPAACLCAAAEGRLAKKTKPIDVPELRRRLRRRAQAGKLRRPVVLSHWNSIIFPGNSDRNRCATVPGAANRVVSGCMRS
jgi:NAD(P)-dependent dehydrogenase (short-subunit alcohol dehydrogenase family)